MPRSAYLLLLLLMMMMIMRAPRAAACDVHVDGAAHGNGDSDGSRAAPFATIGAAQRALRGGGSRRRRGAAAATRVCVAAGVYREALRFTAEDSGAGPLAPVIYEAAPGAAGNVSISGSLPVTFAPLPTDDPARALLPPAAAAHVSVADLFAAGLTPAELAEAAAWLPRGFAFGGCRTSPLELVVNGAVQEVARWPNAADASQGTAPGFALTAWHEPSGGLSNASFWVNSSVPWLRFNDLSTLQLHGFWHYEWSDGIAPFGGVLATDGDLVNIGIAGPGGEGQVVTGAARYFVTNALEALDSEGEYFVNASSGRLFAWLPAAAALPAGSDAQSVTVNATTLITFDHAADVWLSGITVEGARGHGLQLLSSRGIVLSNVTVRNVGQDALNAYLSNDTLVASSRLLDPGCAGARFMDGGDRSTLRPSGNVVVDSEVARFDRLVYTYNPGIGLDSGAVAAHCDVHDSPHFCLNLDGNDVAVLGNVIHGCSASTFDNAAIYWYPTDWTKRNTTIRFNFFYLNGQGASTCNPLTSCNRDAIYPDNGSAAPSVADNVVYHPRGRDLTCEHCTPLSKIVSYGYFADGTREGVVTNNLFVLDNANFTFNGAAGLTWDHVQQGNDSSYLEDLRAVNWDAPGSLFAARYPDLARLRGDWPAGGAAACALDEDCGPSPARNVFATNVIVNATELFTPPPPPFATTPFFNFSDNFQTAGDPGFVAGAQARATLDFQLRDDSPVYSATGFQRIPMECFGPGKRCPGEPDWGSSQRAMLRAVASAPAHAPVPVPADDYAWLLNTTRRMLLGCQITGIGGVQLFTPDASSSYGAQWTRDFAMAVTGAGLSGAFGDANVTAAVAYTLDRVTADGMAPDRVQADGKAVFAPGGPGSWPILLAWDNMPYAALLLTAHERAWPSPGFFCRYEPVARRALDFVVLRDGLAYNDPAAPNCSFGFEDSVVMPGRMLTVSALTFSAAQEMAGLAGATGCGDAGHYAALAAAIAARVGDLYDGATRLFNASDGLENVPDVFGSALAATLGLASSEQAAGIADFLAEQWAASTATSTTTTTIWQEGQARHLPYPLLWKQCWGGGCPSPGTYQNGAFWATPLNWLLPAMAENGHAAEAAEVAAAAISSFRASGVMEAINRDIGYTGVRDYVASATNLLGVVAPAS